MTPQNPLERFRLANAEVKIEPYKQTNEKTRWIAYGHPQKRPYLWVRIAACDTESEIRIFCADWKLNIVEVGDRHE